ncbi:MAG: hypothetical protein WCC21_19765 [Candidatus Acidiferrales bacterium]
MTMSTTITTRAPLPAKQFDRPRDRGFTEIFTWWFILAAIAAAALFLHAAPAGAQQIGPLPAATPSDEPPPPPQSTAPKLIGGKPSIAGTWALNKDDSDDPRQAMRDAARSGSGGGGNSGGNGGGSPRVGMGGGWGGRGGGGNGGNGTGGGHRGGQSVENPADDLSQLTIDQTATSATVTNEAGRVIAQYTAGSTPPSGPTMKNRTPGASGNSSSSASTSTAPPSSSAPGAEGAPPSSNSGSDPGRSNTTDSDDHTASNAQWKGSQFVAVTPGRRQGSTTRTYELSPDGKQLYVTTKIENPRFQNPVTFRLVYDSAPSTE